MVATASIRQLRNQFPKVGKLVEQEGEVLVTDRGKPKYRLTLYRSGRRRPSPPPKDYLARLRKHQPHAISAAAARKLHEENRGDR